MSSEAQAKQACKGFTLLRFLSNFMLESLEPDEVEGSGGSFLCRRFTFTPGLMILPFSINEKSALSL